MDWRRWASIARLSIRKMCCPNGSKKLLAQKIFTCLFLFLRPFRLFVFFGIITGAGRIFRTKCDFLQVLDLLIFRQ